MADRARNDAGLGKAVTLNVLTPILPWRRCILQIWLRILDLSIWLQLALAKRFGSANPAAYDLSILAYVHWVVIPRKRFPRVSRRQPAEQLHYDYLLFLTSFTGPWTPYIDAFADVLGSALDSVWFWTIAYPGANPVTGLLAHIQANRIESDHYYSAYPGASVRDVRAAIKVQAAVAKLATNVDALDPARFAQEYQRVISAIGGDLGPIGTLP
jgi:hypothetical protein